MKLFLSSLFLLLLAPCNNHKKIGSTTPDYSKLVITYECGACFGRCPIYYVTINGATKTATFIGKQNTEKIGTYTKAVTDAELADFVKVFTDTKFTSFNNEYLGPIADFPIKTTIYTNNGTTKTIKDRSGSPDALRAVEKTIAAFAETTEGWKKTDDSTSDH